MAWGSLDGEPVLASAGLDGSVRLWDPVGGAQLRVLTGHNGGVLALAWGSLSGSTVLISAGSDAIVRLWDPRRFREVVIKFENLLLDVSISPDGRLGIAGLGGLAVLEINSGAFANPQTAQQSSFSAAGQ